MSILRHETNHWPEGKTTEIEGRGTRGSQCRPIGQLPLAGEAPCGDRHMEASEGERDMHRLGTTKKIRMLELHVWSGLIRDQKTNHQHKAQIKVISRKVCSLYLQHVPLEE